MKKLVLALCAAALLAPAAAAGGGWATVGVSTLPPDGLQPGDKWAVDLTVLQHGRTPLEGVSPVVRLRGPDGQVEEFTATPTGKPGVYHAVVAFPASGRWSYEIWDGFSRTHTFKPVTIGGEGAAPSSGLVTALVLAAALALLLAAVAIAGVVVLRRRSPVAEPAEVTQLKEAA